MLQGSTQACVGASRESDGGFKVEQLMGWSHCLRGGGRFRCVSTEPRRNPTGVLPGNPWQQLLLSHFLVLGGRYLLSSWRLFPPGKHSSLNLSCWHVSNTQEILNSAHSALLSMFTYDHLSPAASGLQDMGSYMVSHCSTDG